MGDVTHHSKLAREKREAALDEFKKARYTVVGDLSLKAVEQTIEAIAAKSDKHFHTSPRTAHAERVKWAKATFPKIAPDLDIIWGAYGDLGYNGLDGKRAKEAVEAMERIINELEKQTKLRIK